MSIADDKDETHYWFDPGDGETFHDAHRYWTFQQKTPDELRALGFKLFSEATREELFAAILELNEQLERARND